MKTCNKCGIEKDLDSFGNHKRMVDGKQRRCRACVKEINANYYTKKLKFSRQELTAFKEEKLKNIRDEISANEEEYESIKRYRFGNREDTVILKSLIDRCRFINYYPMNDRQASWHTWKGTDRLLRCGKQFKEQGRDCELDWDISDMMNYIYKLDNMYECKSCGSFCTIDNYDYLYYYNIDWHRDYYDDRPIANFKIVIKDYCEHCEWSDSSNINKKRQKLRDKIKSLEGMYIRERGVGRKVTRQRARWSEQKDKHMGKYNTNLSTGDDGRFLYIMKYKDLYKVGMSKNPYKRREGINNALKDKGVKLLYVGQPFEGRSVDNEGLIHKSLSEYREDVYWKTGSKSREFYRCDLDLIMSAMQEHCLLDSV